MRCRVTTAGDPVVSPRPGVLPDREVGCRGGGSRGVLGHQSCGLCLAAGAAHAGPQDIVTFRQALGRQRDHRRRRGVDRVNNARSMQTRTQYCPVGAVRTPRRSSVIATQRDGNYQDRLEASRLRVARCGGDSRGPPSERWVRTYDLREDPAIEVPRSSCLGVARLTGQRADRRPLSAPRWLRRCSPNGVLDGTSATATPCLVCRTGGRAKSRSVR